MYDKTIVVFGATGDLSRRKIIPALETLYHKGLLGNTKVIGCARSAANREEWLERLDREYDEGFLEFIYHHKCDLSDAKSLESIPVEGDSTFFLSVPPEQYENAIRNLKSSGHLDDPERSRVVIEKPFGYDLQSANRLQSVVDGSLREKQVYRIDHYLGKDTVNNILATRFSNTVLEPLWNRNYVEEVQIFATETISCEGRAQYYEGAGAVRDMLQNHMLQVMSLIAMEPPCRLDATEIRREKTKVLAATRLGHKIIFGQYDGYKHEEGVEFQSNTPTFVAGDLYVDNWRWKDVPFHFMTGKKLPYGCVEVVLKLKSPPLKLYEGLHNDRIVIRIQPDAHLDIQLEIKAPGLDERVQSAALTFDYPEGALDGYVRLLYDALRGDQSHFVHSEEVLESWRIVDDLLCVGDSCPIRTTPYLYIGTWGPPKTQLITHWDYPSGG